MSQKSGLFHGVVRNGVVVLDPQVQLPEGTHVDVAPTSTEFTPEERAEFEAWDRLSAEAFKMIEDLEREERNEGR